MVSLNGSALTLEDVALVARAGGEVELDPHAVRRMKAAREVIDRLAAGEAPVYAVNTGVGLLADTRVAPEELDQLQRNVVRSHACGVGEPLPDEVVRAIMLIRANVLAKGVSGIRPVVARRLCGLLNKGVTPVVPSRGSVGASGDLAPLAHIALVLIGEGEARYQDRRMSGGAALEAALVEPLRLHSKEGISLVNGTQAMLALGSLALLDSEDLTEAADVACALSLDALRGTPKAFDPRIHEVRPHPGQLASARLLLRLLEGSEIRASHQSCRRVQDAYSLRCAPQVHGAVRDTLTEARRVFSIELNSATDNPLVFGEETLSGGNFHGQHLAFAMDYLAIALTALAGISERRIDRLVNPALNEGLPAFLANHPGLESGFMMVQVTAAALVAECRVLATPASPGTITTSGNKEDFVSMGMTSALKLRQTVELTRQVLAIELMTATQALEFLRPLKTSPTLEAIRAAFLKVCPPRKDDQPFSSGMAAAAEWLKNWRTVRPANVTAIDAQ
ncbi:histidine ammonia-lyase [uncultured Paludibaculum sp.]|uniref:histidine ammonia-lyase n=1 Tax=uncultured Paludibaculum sp. TaxID=1765020 RepID=UPI002AAB029B|nr:histidine ammonia-lyase [uncultured Paludibaculum sp.]